MAQDPTKIQIALANAASVMLQLHNVRIAGTNDLHICDDPDALMMLRALTLKVGQTCDAVFAAIAAAGDVAPTRGNYATIVSDALEGNLQFSLREKVEEIYEARSEPDYMGAYKNLQSGAL